MPQSRQTFGKKEKLCSRKMIEVLFVSGKVLYLRPFRAVYTIRTDGEDVPVKVVLAVSKRNFKKAVDRNLIKRRMREAYRQNKGLLYELLVTNSLKIALMIQYTGKEMLSHRECESNMKSLLEKLGREASNKMVSHS